ncbi:MAG: VOC family protein, partial [Myxococcota bacterium]
WSGVGTVFPTSPADGTSADQDVLDWVAANGGTVRAGPLDTADGRIAVCADPEGAVFVVVRRTP